jgi:hypothetical protein
LKIYADGPVPNPVDPRHFPSIAGTAPTVEELSGKWAPAADYGSSIVTRLNQILATQPTGETTMLTDHEIEELKRLVASLDSVNSNGSFAEHAVALIRKERTLPLDQMVAKGQPVVIRGTT